MAQEKKQNKLNLKSNVKDFVIDWNNKFPIDFWWRKKYNIPFGSKAHREANFIDMLIEFEEQKMMVENVGKTDDDFDNDENFEVMNQDEIDEEYDKLLE
jgi:hypothetical protein